VDLAGLEADLHSDDVATREEHHGDGGVFGKTSFILGLSQVKEN